MRATRVYFTRMRVGSVGTAHILPPLPINKKRWSLSIGIGAFSYENACFWPIPHFFSVVNDGTKMVLCMYAAKDQGIDT